MRILSVGNRYPPWSVGGYEVVWASSVRALRAAGHPTRVLTTVPDPSDRTNENPRPADVHRELGWYWRNHEFPRIGLRATVALERANAAALARHIRDHEPDVVLWSAMGGMSMSLLEQVRRAGVPAVGIVGDEWMLYGPRVDAWTSRWRGRGRPAAALAERMVGVPTRLDLDRGRWLFNGRHLLEVARRSELRLPNSEIMAPGVNARRFSPRKPQRWRWRLLYCGRIDARKGIATAIEALAHLPAEATLRVHGDGSAAAQAELRSVAERVGVSDRVGFGHGEHELVPETYAAADAVVFPVIWQEPWGLAPLEAMAIGRPLVASRADGGPAEYLRDGRNCLQFEPGDAAGLATVLIRLAADDRLRAELVREGHATASRFTEQGFHERLERELRQLVGASRLESSGSAGSEG